MPPAAQIRTLLLLTFGLATSQELTHAGRSPAQESSPSAGPILAVRLASYGAYQETAWTHLPSIGVRHLFMNAPSADELPTLKARLDRAKLDVAVFRGEFDMSRADCLERLEKQLAVCKQMGVRYLFVSPKHAGVSLETSYQRLREAGQLAERYGVTISLETHPDLGTNGEVQLETMKRVDQPRIRVNFDTGNITYYNQGTDAVAELRKILPYVATVEFKDHDGKLKSWYFPALGTGRVDFPGVVAELRNAHFQGPMTIEIEGIENQPWDERQTQQAIADSVAYLRQLGLTP
jgi:sugar phosphate isomerase/epimerase